MIAIQAPAIAIDTINCDPVANENRDTKIVLQLMVIAMPIAMALSLRISSACFKLDTPQNERYRIELDLITHRAVNRNETFIIGANAVYFAVE